MHKARFGRNVVAILLGLICFCLLLAGVYLVSREGARYRIPTGGQEADAAPETRYETPVEPGPIPFGQYILWIEGAVLALGVGFIALAVVSAKRKKKIQRLMAQRRQRIDAFGQVVYALCGILENWDEEPGRKEHVMRVARYARVLAKHSGLSDDEAEQIGIYAMLHDIGMIYVPREILRKSGSLSPEEYARVKKHVDHGYNLAARYGLHDTACHIIRYHHEQWDGNGYHRGMSGEKIPLAARIVGLADTYDTLRMERVYRPSYTHAEAVEVIREERGRMLDPTLVDMFSESHTVFETIYDKGSEEVRLPA